MQQFLRTLAYIALAIVALYLAVRYLLPFLRRPNVASLTLPMDLAELIPATWTVIPDKYYHCDFSRDGEPDWLVIYRYDPTSVQGGVAQTGAPATRTAIGGVIFDPRVNRVPQRPGSESPYRPGFLFPYKLLPDIYPSKGQGYLGETGVDVTFSPPPASFDKGCSVPEIAIYGYSDSPVPTRLSLFRWGGPEVGYLSRHFVGNARISTTRNVTADQAITEVQTFTRFNERSRLCEARDYRRSSPDSLEFAEDASRYSIDFCFGAPADPAYPEGVVVATLRGASAGNATPNASPTGTSFLTGEAVTSLPGELANLQNPGHAALRIIKLENPGSLPDYPQSGTVITDTATQTAWLWGPERVAITTTVVLSSGVREVGWQLVSMASYRVPADTHWRIEQVKLAPPETP